MIFNLEINLIQVGKYLSIFYEILGEISKFLFCFHYVFFHDQIFFHPIDFIGFKDLSKLGITSNDIF